MSPFFLLISGLSGALAVALGAFGAHALKARVSPDQLSTFTTGVQYHMYHALGLGLVGMLLARSNAGLVSMAGWLFILGTILFSGSLYALVLTRTRWLGAITPFGGIAFVAGWLCFAFGAFQS